MLSKSKIKWIISLKLKKNRDEEGVFVAEGLKVVSELLPLLRCRFLAVCSDVSMEAAIKTCDETVEISNSDYQKITFQKSPQGVLAVFEKPRYELNFDKISRSLSLALDDIQDPGNLGTIIRTADWYGVKDIFCSRNSADVFNPKVVQATMGAIARVRVHYVDLPDFLKGISNSMPIYGTLLDGDNFYKKELSDRGILVMGNEGNGISSEIIPLISERLFIPGYPTDVVSSESLNVSIATAITLAEFRRRM